MNFKVRTKASKVTYPAPLPKSDSVYSQKRTRVSFSTSDRATRRVIAPYVKIVRKGKNIEPLIERKEENKQFSYYLQRKPSVLLRNLSAFLSDSVDLSSLLNETADVLKVVTNASGVTLYSVDEVMNEIYQNPRNVISDRHRVNWKIEPDKTVAQFVALNKEYVMVDDIIEDPRFPDGIGYKNETAKSVLCAPVVTPKNDCIAVIELYRDVSQEPFDKNHAKILITVTGWMGAALHQNEQRINLQKQQELNDYLLDLTKCYFGASVNMEKIISEIVSFAKTTLGAERGSFFAIDQDSDELVADLFDEGLDDGDNILHKKNLKIRFSKNRGIAGLVARTGITVNIKDAYNDPRFNKEIDQKTGFITRSILCMPVLGIEGILGVIQVINKINGPCFTASDESLFKTFSVYCGLSLQYSRLHTINNRTDKLNKCYHKLLKYHMRPCHHDIEIHSTLLGHSDIPPDFNEYEWYISSDVVPQMPELTLYMIVEVVGEANVQTDRLMEFILTARKSYRFNPYHNFDHAFNVCHCMYNMLKRNLDMFNECELKGLILAALCHDLDHGGFTNNFLMLTNDTLVQLYDESPLENHHYQVTMTILQDNPVFGDMSENLFKRISNEIKDAILATDLATYFKCRIKLLQVLHDDLFDWYNVNHRSLVKAIMMTTADLSGQCKPYPVAKKITDNLYREFYNQGDMEKLMGLQPLSMMDREKQNMVPEDQVQFLTVVVMPCADLLQNVVPHTDRLFQNCVTLRDTWREIIEFRGKKVWRQDDSIVENVEIQGDSQSDVDKDEGTK